MKKLILHIGMHKTGTTSIQQVFGESRKLLMKYDIYYPEIKPFNHSTSFPPIFLNDPSSYEIFRQRGIYNKDEADKEQVKLREVWKEEFKKSKCKYFIISGEELTLIDEESVGNLKDFIFEYFDDILIVMYVRHPNSFYPSVLSEYIKHGGESILQNSYSEAFPLYRYRLQKYINVFGLEKIRVRPFDKQQLKNGDLLEDFFACCDLNVDVNELPQKKVNESLDENTVTFLLEYNRRYPRYKNGRINEERGLPYGLHHFYNIINKINNKKFKLKMNYSKIDAIKINEEIEYINQFLLPKEKFQTVEMSNEPVNIPSTKDIPIEFYIDLINEYNKEIDRLLMKIDGYFNLNEKLNKKIEFLESKEKSINGELPNGTVDSIEQLLSELYKRNLNNRRKKIKNLFLYLLNRKCKVEFFDSEFYKKNYPDVENSKIDPLKHFLLYGAYEGRNPSRRFNTWKYINENPEIVISGENPLFHQLKSNK